MPGFPVPDGARFLFIGDSITDCDRRGWAAPLGNGYVRFFADLVTWRHPQRRIRWLNRGVGGDVTSGLRARWRRDALELRPDWLGLMIGINDCHGNLAGPEDQALQRYRDDLGAMLEQLQPQDPRLVLLQPFYMARRDGQWPADPFQRRVLDRLQGYHRVLKELARQHDALLVRTQDLFQRQLALRPPTCFGPEPVHPHAHIHLLIALELYAAMAGRGPFAGQDPPSPRGGLLARAWGRLRRSRGPQN